MTIRTPHFFSFVIAWFLICSLVQADTLREYLQRKCNEGEEKSCQRAEAMLQGEKLGDRIDELGDRFAATVDRLNREDNNKPILKNAYLDVLDHYFKSSIKQGEQTPNNETFTLCAEHFHDYWRNRKMWWPTNEEGKPDWSAIYYYIVDHYYGYCLAIITL